MTLAWTPISIVVPEKWIDRCREYGTKKAKLYRERTGTVYNRFKRDENSAKVQGMSKLTEVAAVLACEVDPEELDWGVHERVDHGWDFQCDGLKIDVKGTWHPQAKYLIYDAGKVQGFDAAGMDLLMLVWAAAPGTKNFGYCEVRGWSFKEEFKLNRHVVTKADWKFYRMVAGTWAMHQNYLLPMGTLVGGKWRDAADLRGKVFGGAAPLKEARHSDRGDGEVESGLGEQAVPVGMRAAGDG